MQEQESQKNNEQLSGTVRIEVRVDTKGSSGKKKSKKSKPGSNQSYTVPSQKSERSPSAELHEPIPKVNQPNKTRNEEKTSNQQFNTIAHPKKQRNDFIPE